MDIKIVIFELLVVLVSSACRKPCTERDYIFLASAHFYPEKDTLSVGDSLWLISSIPKTLKDQETQKDVTYSNAQSFGTTIAMLSIDNFDSPERGAIDGFEASSIIGRIYSAFSSSEIEQLSFFEGPENYELKILFVAKRKGAYIFDVDDASFVTHNHNSSCGKANYIILNNNANPHLNLFVDRFGTLSSHDSARSYCFVVK